MIRLSVRKASLLAATCLAGAAATSVLAQTEIKLDELVVTATGRPEPRSSIPGTIQVIDAAQIERSSAKSITDLLAENAVGFFSEWTPGQTSTSAAAPATARARISAARCWC